MSIEQAAYVIIYAIPVVSLGLDYWIDETWTESLIKFLKWPWIVFSIVWMVQKRDWTALVFIIVFGLAFFLQPAWKDLEKR